MNPCEGNSETARLNRVNLSGAFDEQELSALTGWHVDVDLVSRPALEHIPKKLLDFYDQDMLQIFDIERILIDQMVPSDRDAL